MNRAKRGSLAILMVVIAVLIVCQTNSIEAASCRLDWNGDSQIDESDYLVGEPIGGFYAEWFIFMYYPDYYSGFFPGYDTARLDYDGDGVIDRGDLMGTLDAVTDSEGFYTEWYIFVYYPEHYPTFFPEYNVCPPNAKMVYCSGGEAADCGSGEYCDTTLRQPICKQQTGSFWTDHQLPPEVVGGDRRVYYVSSSEGDDSTANNGSMSLPFKTINRAYRDIRQLAGAYAGDYDNSNRHLERSGPVRGLHAAVLLKRGDVFDIRNEEAYLGKLESWNGRTFFLAIETGGEAADKRFIISSYGEGGPADYDGPRPVIDLTWPKEHSSTQGRQSAVSAIGLRVSEYGLDIGAPTTTGTWCPTGDFDACIDQVRTASHITVAGMEIRPSAEDALGRGLYYRDHLSKSTSGFDLRDGLIEDWLIEDVYIHHLAAGIETSHKFGLQDFPHGHPNNDLRLLHDGLKIRRCIFANFYMGEPGQSVPLALSVRKLENLWIEESVFDETCWNPNLDPVSIFDAGLFPGLEDAPVFNLPEGEVVSSFVGQYGAGKYENTWGGFSEGAAPHAVYVRHESGDNYVIRGNIVLRPGANRDKWHTGITMVDTVYIQSGGNIGNGDYISQTSEGEGYTDGIFRDNGFITHSQRYGDYGIAFRGIVGGATLKGNVFSNPGSTQRPLFTVENTGDTAVALSYDSNGFTIDGQSYPLVTSGDFENNRISLLCNFINNLPGRHLRCALRERAGFNITRYLPASGVSATLQPGSAPFIVYSKYFGGEYANSAIQLADRWLKLDFAEDPFAHIPEGYDLTRVKIVQPSTGAEGWLRGEQKIWIDETTSPPKYRFIVEQHGSTVTTPVFRSSADGGGELIITEETLCTADNSPVVITSLDYAVTRPTPAVIEDNVFDIFNQDIGDALPRGHAIRLAGATTKPTIRNNLFYAKIPFSGEASGTYERTDYIQVTPFAFPNQGTGFNEYLDCFSYAELGDAWSQITWEQMLPRGLELSGNVFRYGPQGDQIASFKPYVSNPSNPSSSAMMMGDEFLGLDEFCAALPSGSYCPVAQQSDANIEVTSDAAWTALGLPAPGQMATATFENYRQSIAGALLPDRYQNSTSLDHELDTMSHILRQKRRGNWSFAYDAYHLLNHFRAAYDMPPLVRPYQ